MYVGARGDDAQVEGNVQVHARTGMCECWKMCKCAQEQCTRAPGKMCMRARVTCLGTGQGVNAHGGRYAGDYSVLTRVEICTLTQGAVHMRPDSARVRNGYVLQYQVQFVWGISCARWKA